ncbi:MAG: hypothetical protein R3B13_08975 [Polyangiaceae bacterium]
MVAFESIARLLQFLHWIAAIAATAACVHLIVRLWRARGDRRAYVHARTLLVAYALLYGLGSLVYPTFRVRVRAEFLDRVYPWATGLFEIKEQAATLALVPVVGIFLLLRRPGEAEPSRKASAKYSALALGLSSFVLLVLVFNACVGWYLGTLGDR